MSAEIRQAYESASRESGRVAAAQEVVYERTIWLLENCFGLAGTRQRLAGQSGNRRQEIRMSLLGIDVGTTGCKAAAFSEEGALLASAYEEYDLYRPQPGWAELDPEHVWDKIQATVRRVSGATSSDPIQALAVSSLGEAMVPVTADRRIVGPSIIANFDLRGEEYLEPLRVHLDDETLYGITGNRLGRNYSLPKLGWIRQHQPELYRKADKFLLWGSFVSYMLGARPAVDYSLANRTLLFDLEHETWSPEILNLTQCPRVRPSARWELRWQAILVCRPASPSSPGRTTSAQLPLAAESSGKGGRCTAWVLSPVSRPSLASAAPRV
jgi:hypothetical protein